MENRHQLAKLKYETNEQLAKEKQDAMRIAAERERQQLRAALAQQKLEMQFCQANQLAQQSQIREDVHSKVAFNVVQGLEVGELEVDAEELQKLLDQRKEEQQRTPPQSPQRGPVQKACGCDWKECGCEPGLLKRHCFNCRQKSCDCPEENLCGGPQALQQAQQQGPRPIRPTEIPLKLPVRLTFGMQNPRVEQAQILPGLPYAPQQAPQQQKGGPYYGPTQKSTDASQHEFIPVTLPTPIPDEY